MRFGIDTFLFSSPFTNESTKLFSDFKAWGFDTVEIALEEPTHMDAIFVKSELDRYGPVCGFGCDAMGPDRNLKGTPEQQHLFQSTGFAANRQHLAGCLAQTVRMTKLNGVDGKTPQRVVVGNASFSVGAVGFCEFLRVDPLAGTAVTGKFSVEDPYLDKQAALVHRKLGSGNGYKLAFWPESSHFTDLLKLLYPVAKAFFRTASLRTSRRCTVPMEACLW